MLERNSWCQEHAKCALHVMPLHRKVMHVQSARLVKVGMAKHVDKLKIMSP